jgi:hypothetical protein
VSDRAVGSNVRTTNHAAARRVAAIADITQIAGHKKDVWALAYTPDGTTLISAGDDHLI